MQPSNENHAPNSINEALLSIALAIQTSFGKASPQQSYVVTDQTTTSTSYTDLATAQSLSVDIGTNKSALVILTGGLYNVAAPKYMSVAVSGATTRAANDDDCIRADAAAFGQLTTTAFIISGLNPGTNVFTAKFRVASGTGNFFQRRMIVIPL